MLTKTEIDEIEYVRRCVHLCSLHKLVFAIILPLPSVIVQQTLRSGFNPFHPRTVAFS